MFQFRRLPSYTYVFSIWYTSYTCMDCSIRKSTDQSVLTAPRSLSQLITSFFGSQCQGIRPALFLALPFVSCSEFSWLLINILCSFYPTIIFKLSFYTRSILICITFALFCFQVAFCSFWEQISIINSSWLLKCVFKKYMVGTNGLEPSTSRLSGVRSNHLSYAPNLFGGDEEDRTPDPLRARQMLSQLSYTPITFQHLQNWTMFYDPCWLEEFKASSFISP